MINAQEIQGRWNQIRGQVKERWGQLTDEDLTIQGGNLDELIGRIQQRTGEAREAIEQFLGSLTSRSASGVAQVAERAREVASQAGDRLRAGYSQFGEAARERYERAEDLVRHRPGQSVAAAFGMGLLVGVVVGLAFRPR